MMVQVNHPGAFALVKDRVSLGLREVVNQKQDKVGGSVHHYTYLADAPTPLVY